MTQNETYFIWDKHCFTSLNLHRIPFISLKEIQRYSLRELPDNDSLTFGFENLAYKIDVPLENLADTGIGKILNREDRDQLNILYIKIA